MSVTWVAAVLEHDRARADRAARFWATVSDGTPRPTNEGGDEFCALVPRHGDATMFLRTTGSTATASSPAPTVDTSLDLWVDRHETSPDLFAQRLCALGAQVVAVSGGEDAPVLLRSPGGLGCRVLGRTGVPAPPAPAVVGGAGPALADQVCLDIPAAAFDEESAFWAEATGWPVHDSTARPEFRYLARPAAVAVRILLQRRDDAEPGDPVRAHVDLAAGAARDAVVAAHESLGAQVLARFPFWTVLGDPTGRRYCVTARDPVTGTLS